MVASSPGSPRPSSSSQLPIHPEATPATTPPLSIGGGDFEYSMDDTDVAASSFDGASGGELGLPPGSALPGKSERLRKKQKKHKKGGGSSSSSPSISLAGREENLLLSTPPPDKLRRTRPPGLSPQHAHSRPSGAAAFFGESLDGARLLGPPIGSSAAAAVGDAAAAGSGSNAAKTSKNAAKRKRKKKDVGTVFQRDSPDAKKSLRSFLLNFTDDSSFSIKDSINLHRHSLDTGKEVTNVLVQEVCVMKPDMTSLNLSQCRKVTDVGLWAIARHCTKLRELTLSQCEGVTNIGLRSLAMKCTSIQVLDFSKCRLVPSCQS